MLVATGFLALCKVLGDLLFETGAWGLEGPLRKLQQLSDPCWLDSAVSWGAFLGSGHGVETPDPAVLTTIDQRQSGSSKRKITLV